MRLVVQTTAICFLDRIGQRPTSLIPLPLPSICNHVTGRWGGLTLAVLAGGPHSIRRDLERLHGISENMLTSTLRELEGEAIIIRSEVPDAPPRIAYTLTAFGKQIAMFLDELRTLCIHLLTLSHCDVHNGDQNASKMLHDRAKPAVFVGRLVCRSTFAGAILLIGDVLHPLD